MKDTPYVYALKRLHKIKDEYLKLEKSEGPADQTENKDSRFVALEAEASGLIDMLMWTNAVPKPITNEIRGDIEVALRAMANVLPEYSDDWLDENITSICRTTTTRIG